MVLYSTLFVTLEVNCSIVQCKLILCFGPELFGLYSRTSRSQHGYKKDLTVALTLLVANWFSGSVVTFQVIAITKISCFVVRCFILGKAACCLPSIMVLSTMYFIFLAIVMTNYIQLRILRLHWKGLKVSAIAECLVHQSFKARNSNVS